MAMKAETIKARMDKLYNSDWVNFNLFVPELLMVSGMNYSETDEGKGEWKESTSSGGGGQDLINIIKDIKSFFIIIRYSFKSNINFFFFSYFINNITWKIIRYFGSWSELIGETLEFHFIIC